MKYNLRFVFCALVGLSSFIACQQKPVYPTYSNGVVSTAHPLASEVGLEILKKGGNAFDAAVAVQFALAVVYPGAGNIAGGGFLVYRKSDGTSSSLDFREKAPLKANRDMYLDEIGNPIAEKSREGGLAVGVPGSVDGMFTIHKALCTMPMDALIRPAIDLAKNGFPLTQKEADKLNDFKDAFQKNNPWAIPFVKNAAWKKGDRIRIPELAETLERIAKEGRTGFYSGKTAQLIVDQMKASGGIISPDDLAQYRSQWRTPIISSYKDTFRIISMGPPSAGGIAMAQMLKGWEKYPVSEWGHNSVKSIHLMTELERRAYADRAKYIGDPDYYNVPQEKLLNAAYLKDYFSDISLTEKTDSKAIEQGEVQAIESFETTHFSIVDKDGNAAAVTTTLNSTFGSKVMVKGGGFFLNNEMDDFSAKPGSPNQFGLTGSEANAIQPEKRMVSSMTPTIVEKAGKLFMVIGTPGGSTIITSVFQTIVNVIDFDMDIQSAIDAKKTHSQWLPDKIYVENNGIPPSVVEGLQKMGHEIEETEQLGKMAGVLVLKDGTYQGGADTKRADNNAVGY